MLRIKLGNMFHGFLRKYFFSRYNPMKTVKRFPALKGVFFFDF